MNLGVHYSTHTDLLCITAKIKGELKQHRVPCRHLRSAFGTRISWWRLQRKEIAQGSRIASKRSDATVLDLPVGVFESARKDGVSEIKTNIYHKGEFIKGFGKRFKTASEREAAIRYVVGQRIKFLKEHPEFDEFLQIGTALETIMEQLKNMPLYPMQLKLSKHYLLLKKRGKSVEACDIKLTPFEGVPEIAY